MVCLHERLIILYMCRRTGREVNELFGISTRASQSVATVYNSWTNVCSKLHFKDTTSYFVDFVHNETQG